MVYDVNMDEMIKAINDIKSGAVDLGVRYGRPYTSEWAAWFEKVGLSKEFVESYRKANCVSPLSKASSFDILMYLETELARATRNSA